MRREDEELPAIIPMGEEALEELLRAARDTEAPMDDTLLLGRVKLSKVTLRNMTKNKAKLNRRFKRNRVRKVGRPKSHHLTKKKLKKANNRRNYLKNVKPRRGDRCEKTDIV